MNNIPVPMLFTLNQALRRTSIYIGGSIQTWQLGQFILEIGRNDLSISYAGQSLDGTARLIDKGGDETGLILLREGHGRFYVPAGSYVVKMEF